MSTTLQAPVPARKAPAKAAPAVDWSMAEAAHLLNRAGFGGSPGEIVELHQLGRARAVQSLLAGDEDADLFPTPQMTSPTENALRHRAIRAVPPGMARLALAKDLGIRQNQELTALRAWWVNRMRYSPYPLREKMALFWHGHFATSFEKVGFTYLLWQQNETFRYEGLGDFRKLTGGISRDPAMMRYLDLDVNSRTHPNENFAREVMELFLLGEGVVYTEKDVQEAARAFTGYRTDPTSGEYRFNLSQFDNTPKQFMGRVGNFNGDDILDIIFEQPQCAEFITRKIWAFFAGAPISPALAAKLSAGFQNSGYNISSLLEWIFLSPEFYSPAVIGNQVKSPVQWLVQMTRELEVPLPSPKIYQQALVQMGQQLFYPPNVKGWEGGRAWINGTTFLARCNLTGNLLGGLKKNGPLNVSWQHLAPEPVRHDAPVLCSNLSSRFFSSSVAQIDQARFVEFLEKHGPVATDGPLREVTHLMMSSPEYQLT